MIFNCISAYKKEYEGERNMANCKWKRVQSMKKYFLRLKHPATIIGIAGYIVTIISEFGISIDNDAVMTIIKSVCAICVLLGILNNPETTDDNL